MQSSKRFRFFEIKTRIFDDNLSALRFYQKLESFKNSIVGFLTKIDMKIFKIARNIIDFYFFKDFFRILELIVKKLEFF